MKLWPESEITRSNLINRVLSHFLDDYFGELLRTEQRLLTQAALQSIPLNLVAYAAQRRGQGEDMNKFQCYNCKEYGHITLDCFKKFCNYCKQLGHTIKDCSTWAQNRKAATTAYIASETSSSTVAQSTFTPDSTSQGKQTSPSTT